MNGFTKILESGKIPPIEITIETRSIINIAMALIISITIILLIYKIISSK